MPTLAGPAAPSLTTLAFSASTDRSLEIVTLKDRQFVGFGHGVAHWPITLPDGAPFVHEDYSLFGVRTITRLAGAPGKVCVWVYRGETRQLGTR